MKVHIAVYTEWDEAYDCYKYSFATAHSSLDNVYKHIKERIGDEIRNGSVAVDVIEAEVDDVEQTRYECHIGEYDPGVTPPGFYPE